MNIDLLELNEDRKQSHIELICRNPALIPNNNSRYLGYPVDCSPLFKTHNVIVKRILDIIISVIVIAFLCSWLLPLIALLIKIDSSGPIFFTQKRNKKDGRLFYCIKLRTMVANKAGATLTAISNDNCITRVGKFLRASHLDELPQFINVLIGDMSVVGPRPHKVTENVKYTSILNFYNHRHLVKPGITGLAQSFGYHGPVPNMAHLNKKIKYDIFYIKNWSLLLDVKILIRTIGMIFKKLKTVQ